MIYAKVYVDEQQNVVYECSEDDETPIVISVESSNYPFGDISFGEAILRMLGHIEYAHKGV